LCPGINHIITMNIKSILPNKNKELERQLFKDTDALSMPKGRRVGQPGHDVAREYLIARLDEIGLEPFLGDSFELPYTSKLWPSQRRHVFTNLVGVVPGADRSLPPILLGAHYDSVIDAPCADDNATSVAMNLAIAEMVMEHPLERDLIIALYDAEEPPYFLSEKMGSTRFHDDHCQGMSFAGAIVTDLIGHDLSIYDLIDVPTMLKPLLPDTQKIVFMTGAESDSIFPEAVEHVAAKHSGIKIFPTLNSYVGNMSDHHAFEKNGHPFLFFSCAQGKYYHHELDSIDWINFPKLAHITNFVSDLIYQLDVIPAGDAPYGSDPADFEVRMIKKAVGVKLPLLLKAAGIAMPGNRDELDDLINGIVNFGHSALAER
jgi:hypothetical protein